MALVNISISQHIRKIKYDQNKREQIHYDFSCLEPDNTYITTLGINVYSHQDDLAKLKEHTNVLFVSPLAVNRYHQDNKVPRQRIVIFEPKCQDQLEQTPVPSA